MAMWFIYDSYRVAGRPKAEAAVMAYAHENYLYNLVSEEALEGILMDLERYCMKLREENKRLAPVKIDITEKRYTTDGFACIYIGEQHLSLRKVKNTIEY